MVVILKSGIEKKQNLIYDHQSKKNVLNLDYLQIRSGQMKLIKFLLWLIVICLLVILVLQNKDYFLAATSLHIDLKAVDTWNWTFPEIPTGIYFAVCFVLGLILTGLKAVIIKFRLTRQIKAKDTEITSLKDEVNILKTELESFKNDPYIKKAAVEPDAAVAPAGEKEPWSGDNAEENQS